MRPICLTIFIYVVTADELWKSATSVSNAGKKRGRGKGAGRKQAMDLNKGQVLGVGKINVIWPGLNAPGMSQYTINTGF